MEARATPSAAAAPDAALMVGALEASAFGAELGAMGRKRVLEGDEYDEEEEDEAGEFLQGREGKARSAKRSRRHHWQHKYEAEFGLLAIERDAVSGDVTLAMCGFCKAFGREGKYEQLVQADADAGNETKKRRRRSLTTTKFFRAFRVDNIRSHLQGAHPRRWAEYEMLPKQDAVRARYLQMQGDFHQYDNLAMVDDVVLGGSALNAESDIAYAQGALAEPQHAAATAGHAAATAVAIAAASAAGSTPLGNSNTSTGTVSSTSLVYSGTMSADEHPYLRKRNNRLVAAGPRTTFDYEKHLTEQLALDRERLDFEKAKFKKEVELRERELELQQKRMEQDALLHEKLMQSARQNAETEGAKFFRLAEVLREAISSAHANPGTSVV